LFSGFQYATLSLLLEKNLSASYVFANFIPTARNQTAIHCLIYAPKMHYFCNCVTHFAISTVTCLLFTSSYSTISIFIYIHRAQYQYSTQMV